jgi:hypothetical protein
MNERDLEQFESHIQSIARAHPYPPTPDIAAAVAQRLEGKPALKLAPRRRWALAVAVMLILLLSVSLAVPPVRAQILEFLQIGGIRIFLRQPTPTSTPTSQVGTLSEITPTPLPTLQTYPSIEHLSGETTLDAAQEAVDFPIPLPSYPPDLGPPDRVFLQDLESPSVLLVWMDPVEPGQIRLDLLILGSGAFAGKSRPPIIEHTQVNGRPAVWTSGPHFLNLGGRTYKNVPLVVDGNVLIWEQGAITYRLETDLSMQESVRIAESLR